MPTEHNFAIVLEPLEEGGFLVLVPALPEVVTQGKTEAEAMAMAEDAIRLAVDYRLEQGESLPAETSPQLRHLKVALSA